MVRPSKYLLGGINRASQIWEGGGVKIPSGVEVQKICDNKTENIPPTRGNSRRGMHLLNNAESCGDFYYY